MTDRKAPRGGRKEAGSGRSSHGKKDSSDRPKRTYTRKTSEGTTGGSKPWAVHSEGDSGKDSRPKRSYSSNDDKPRRSSSKESSYGDRPKRSYNSDDKPKRSYGDDKPKRSYGSRDSSSGDRPKRSYGSDDKPKRSYGDDKPKRSYGSKDSSYGDRPKRSYGSDDKPKRSYGDKDSSSYGDRPKRSYGSDDRPKRSYGSKESSSYGDRPKRSYGDKDSSYGDRPKRSFNSDDKPKRSYGSKDSSSYGDRPKRSYGSDDKPKRSYGDKPYVKRDSYKSAEGEDRPKRSYSSKDSSYGDRPKRSYGSDDKPKRSYGSKDSSYGDRPKRSYGSDDKPKRSGFKSGSYGDKPFDKDRPKRSYNSDDKPRRPFSGEEVGSDGFKRKSAAPSYISSYEPKDSRERKNRVATDSAKEVGAPKLSAETRLNKFIANSGVCSRREADTFIKAGLVTVNGEVVTELGVKVQPSDEVKFNGELLRGEKKTYLLMNKPKGYVTTVEDPHADKTVMEIVENYCAQRVYPVGRLDKNSTGVLLLTNDGELTLQLTHPSYKKKKIYQVELDKALTKNDMQRLADGIELEDGLSFFDVIEYLNEEKTQFGVEIHSGRNRIIRRMFEYLGYRVNKLDRVYFAGLTKKNLKRGECRFLTDKEVSVLKMGSYE